MKRHQQAMEAVPESIELILDRRRYAPDAGFLENILKPFRFSPTGAGGRAVNPEPTNR
jgi:hypothetical protein